MNGLIQDVQYALRQLRKAPGFTLTAVLALAQGIGAKTAIFTLVNVVLLNNLPVTNPKFEELAAMESGFDFGPVTVSRNGSDELPRCRVIPAQRAASTDPVKTLRSRANGRLSQWREWLQW